MMKACYKYVLGTVLLLAFSLMSSRVAGAQFVTTWIDIGDFQDKYSQIGVIDESSNDHDYPAMHRNSTQGRSEAFWIGAKNWTNPDGQQFEYFTSKIGPRDPGVDYAFPVEDKLIAKWEDTEVTVDGVLSFEKVAIVSEVDPSIPADRIMESTWNMDIGVTVNLRAYAFSNPFHDEYHIVEYTFTNSGNTDDDPEIELEGQTLDEALFFFVHRWRGSDQGAWVGDGGQVWGKYSMVDVVGDGHDTYPVDFTAYYLWKGFEPNFTKWNNLGGPLLEQHWAVAQGDTLGRMSGAYMDGEIVLYAPSSMDDPVYRRDVQPHTIGFMDQDEKLTALGSSHREYYEDGILTRERQTRTPGVPASRMWPHYADRIEPGLANVPNDGKFWEPSNDPSSGRQGGHAATVAFGPYDIPFGESVKVYVARGVGGVDFDASLVVGRQYKLSGADDEAMIAYDADGDGVIEDKEYSFHDVYDLGDEVMTKNQWAMSARDSLFKVLIDARRVFKAMGGSQQTGGELTNYPVPQAPLPPRTFNITGLPDLIQLEWEPITGGPTRVGWEIYRSFRNTWWSPAYECVRDPNGPTCELDVPSGTSLIEAINDPRLRFRVTEDEMPYTCVAGNRDYNNDGVNDCAQGMLDASATSFADTGVQRGTDYFYYLVAVGEDQPVDPEGITGTPGGVPLRSSRYYTQSYQAVNLKRPPYGETGTVHDARVVPNPVNLGSGETIRFAKEDEVAFFNIPGEATIKIYTETGELVETIEHTDGSGDEKWNLTTSSRQLLVSGIYVAVIQDHATGETAFLKFTVIR